MAKKRNLFHRSRKLVTLGSLRLGLELLSRENCIGFHPILCGCKVRNPQNLAGSVPDVPTSANILIQKKEQKSLLLKFVIPLGWSVSAPDAHRRHFFRLTLHSLMQFSTLKFWTKILLIFSVTLPLILVTLLTKIAKLF